MGSPRPRAGDKKTTYDTHNTTTVVNVTSYFNETRLENVTVTEVITQLENITTQENVSVLINETVRYNATYVCPGPKLTSSRRPRVIARSHAGTILPRVSRRGAPAVLSINPARPASGRNPQTPDDDAESAAPPPRSIGGSSCFRHFCL